MNVAIDLAVAKQELGRIDQTLDDKHLLIGGLAVQQYVPTRKSQDIDLVCTFEEAQTIIDKLYPSSDWNKLNLTDDEYRPSFRVTHRYAPLKYGEIVFGPKILERAPYKFVDWSAFLDNAKPFQHAGETLFKIVVPEPAKLAFLKLVAFLGRAVSNSVEKASQDLKDFYDLSHHPDFSISDFYDVLRTSGAAGELAKDINKRFEEPSIQSLRNWLDESSIGAVADVLGLTDPTRHANHSTAGVMAYDTAEIAKIDHVATSKSSIIPRNTLIVVDIQNDFFEGGVLSASDTTSLLGPLNEAILGAERCGWQIVFTRDWHPSDHKSFRSEGGPWPAHCVQETQGAAFHPELHRPQSALIVDIGPTRDDTGYSPFEDERFKSLVSSNDVGTIYVVGIALEYCVTALCKEAAALGKTVIAVESLIRPASDRQAELDASWGRLIEIGVVRALNVGLPRANPREEQP